MTWVDWLALTALILVLMRSLWSGLGPPWHWPARLTRVIGTAAGRVLHRRPAPAAGPDPFTVLQVQHRLGLIATELRVLEAKDADLAYYARAHRIHTRRSAYDQLLAQACELAGVPAQHPGPEGRICRNADERFCAEIELAARGWHW